MKLIVGILLLFSPFLSQAQGVFDFKTKEIELKNLKADETPTTVTYRNTTDHHQPGNSGYDTRKSHLERTAGSSGQNRHDQNLFSHDTDIHEFQLYAYGLLQRITGAGTIENTRKHRRQPQVSGFTL